MDFGLLIGLNIIVVIFAPILVGMFTRDGRGTGLFAGWVTFCLTFGLSLTAWLIYVIVHFVAKFW